LFVLTDISESEPDDKQSLVRLLTYANEFEIEGIIATASCFFTLNELPILPEYIHATIRHYANVRRSLIRHAPDFPGPGFLHSRTACGCGDGMRVVGEHGDTAGSDMLIAAADRQDDRPIWVVIWGGAATLAQALWRIRNDRSEEECAAFVRKLRVHEILGQDDAGAWICHHFPKLHFVRNTAFSAFSPNVSWESAEEERGADESLVSHEWFRTNVIYNHGSLGHAYPLARYIYEGDTPSYLQLIPNGLTDPEYPHFGSWGGRFTREKQAGVRSGTELVSTESEHDPYSMYVSDADSWSYGEKRYTNRFCSIFRWREAFQNDFAARMDWCVQPFESANHNPVAVLNDDYTRNVLWVAAKPGEKIELDASKSYDPDGNALSFDWRLYPEAGTFDGTVDIAGAQTARAVVSTPEAPSGAETHIVLTIRDNGEPNLFAYRRIVIVVD
jgi:hypothetical protein